MEVREAKNQNIARSRLEEGTGSMEHEAEAAYAVTGWGNLKDGKAKESVPAVPAEDHRKAWKGSEETHRTHSSQTAGLSHFVSEGDL